MQIASGIIGGVNHTVPVMEVLPTTSGFGLSPEGDHFPRRRSFVSGVFISTNRSSRRAASTRTRRHIRIPKKLNAEAAEDFCF